MKKLDRLAEKACQVLHQNVGADYAQEKRQRLSGENRFNVLVWLNELDAQNLADLAKDLGIPVADLEITRRTARYL